MNDDFDERLPSRRRTRNSAGLLAGVVLCCFCIGLTILTIAVLASSTGGDGDAAAAAAEAATANAITGEAL